MLLVSSALCPGHPSGALPSASPSAENRCCDAESRAFRRPSGYLCLSLLLAHYLAACDGCYGYNDYVPAKVNRKAQLGKTFGHNFAAAAKCPRCSAICAGRLLLRRLRRPGRSRPRRGRSRRHRRGFRTTSRRTRGRARGRCKRRCLCGGTG